LPTRTGKLKDLAHFDATFFGVHAKQAHVMDPLLRMLLELTHEALIDAGLYYCIWIIKWLFKKIVTIL
jgi:fatty acid synthase